MILKIQNSGTKPHQKIEPGRTHDNCVKSLQNETNMAANIIKIEPKWFQSTSKSCNNYARVCSDGDLGSKLVPLPPRDERKRVLGYHFGTISVTMWAQPGAKGASKFIILAPSCTKRV